MWIQCQGEYDRLAQFDPKAGSLKIYSRKHLGDRAPKISEIEGWFSEHRDDPLVLYRTADTIFFRIHGNDFVLDENTEVQVHGTSQRRKLYVKRFGKTIYETEYALPQTEPTPNDQTPFIEEEDFDFGLFVSNISRDPRRKSVLLGKN